MADDQDQNPLDQLVDLFVYAPVGLLYEYQEVLPKLVKRGKSQVQLARVVGKMAVARGGPDTFTAAAEGVATIIARQITELGEAIGLAPPPPASPAGRDRSGPAAEEAAPALADADVIDVEERPLPIARYDELKAKEIVAMLDDLEPDQLDRIRAHEEANRARKTVLGKLERLGH